MSEQNQKPADNRSASQKITDLENGLIALYQTADNIVRDLQMMKEALKLLGNKVDSVVKATLAGESPTDDVIERIMRENAIEELKQKVLIMQAQGMLSPSEQIAPNSFIVGQDINDQGEIVNHRFQFALYAIQPPELRTKFAGARVGDVLNLQEGKLKFRVMEIYTIQEPKPAEAAPAAPADAAPAASDAQAPAAPAETAPAAQVAQPDQSVTPAT